MGGDWPATEDAERLAALGQALSEELLQLRAERGAGVEITSGNYGTSIDRSEAHGSGGSSRGGFMLEEASLSNLLAEEAAADIHPEDLQQLCEGADVELHGLKGAAELNGRRGRLLRFDMASGRWEVKVVGAGGKKLKPENVRLL